MPPRTRTDWFPRAPLGKGHNPAPSGRFVLGSRESEVLLASRGGWIPEKPVPWDTRVGHELWRLLRGKKTRVAASFVARRLKKPKGFSGTEKRWISGVEKNYNHAAGVQAFTVHGVTRWEPYSADTNKIVVESPMRVDLMRHFGDDADQLVKKLEAATRTRMLSRKEKANTVLNLSQRQFAAKYARENMGSYSSYLAEWLFDTKNWIELCDGKADSIEYVGRGGTSDIRIGTFFSKPEEDEIRQWDGKAVEAYLKRIAKVLKRHQEEVNRDIGWVLHPGALGALMSGPAAELYYAILKNQVEEYSKKWKALFEITSKQHIVKQTLMKNSENVLWTGWPKKVK